MKRCTCSGLISLFQVNVEPSEEDRERSQDNSSCSQLSLDEVLLILQRHRGVKLDGFDHQRGEKKSIQCSVIFQSLHCRTSPTCAPPERL